MQEVATTSNTPSANGQEASNRILTAANVITFTRLLLVPVSLTLLIRGQDVAAGILFGITAATDFLDGLVARKTNSVTKLGQILDPLVDRVLIIAAVLGLLIVNRLPLWIVVVVLLRDAYLLVCGGYLQSRHHIRVPVSYIGKTGMWFLCIGFGGLILNMPIALGLGLCDWAFLPGFNADPYCIFIWFLYIGIILSLTVTVVYTHRGMVALKAALAAQEGGDHVGR